MLKDSGVKAQPREIAQNIVNGLPENPVIEKVSIILLRLNEEVILG
jgi:arginyl-tRNA synthetase